MREQRELGLSPIPNQKMHGCRVASSERVQFMANSLALMLPIESPGVTVSATASPHMGSIVMELFQWRKDARGQGRRGRQGNTTIMYCTCQGTGIAMRISQSTTGCGAYKVFRCRVSAASFVLALLPDGAAEEVEALASSFALRFAVVDLSAATAAAASAATCGASGDSESLEDMNKPYKRDLTADHAGGQ